jgi:hypothetical protein
MTEAYIFLELFGTIQAGLGTIGTCLAHPVSNAETGELTMTDITYDWMPLWTEAETDVPTKHSVKSNKEHRREEEFRSALDSYMANYQKHRAMMSRAKGRH